MKKQLLSSLLLIGILSVMGGAMAFSQTLAPNQPEQDACDALLICGNFYTPYSYQGTGAVLDVSSTPCLSGEANSVFFELQVTTAGTIAFDIVPNDAQDDYDFAVIDITNGNCSNIQQNQIIRCDFNNNEQPNNYYAGGVVGLNASATSNTVTAGAYGQNYVNPINAQVGDVYLIMVNNFGHDNCLGSCPGSGFLLDFTNSTAGFNQPGPPDFDSLLPQCDNSHEVTIQLNQNILCSSIAPDGSDFYLTPSGTVASATGLGCTNGTQGYTDQVHVVFNGNLPYGDYTLHAQVGTDTNTLVSVCNTPLQLPDSINFQVLNNAIGFVAIDSPACQTLRLHLASPVLCSSVAANGSDFSIAGPFNAVVDGAQPIGCTANGLTQVVDVHITAPIPVDGIYHLVAQVGSDGNTMIDTCNNSVNIGTQASFWVNSYNGLLQAGPDTATCEDTVNLYGTNNGTPGPNGFNYSWAPSSNLSSPNSLNTVAQLSPGRHRWILSTVDGAGCILRDSVVVKMEIFDPQINPAEVTTCLGNPVPIVVTGGTQYNWADNPLFQGTSSDLSCSNCSDPFINAPLGDHAYYVRVTNEIGCTTVLSTLIHVLDNPSIQVTPRDTTIKYGDAITLHASGAESYSWSPIVGINDDQSPDPLVNPKQTTTYLVVGRLGNGCMARDSSIVRINFNAPVFMPNAFTPNGDGINDVFGPQGLKFQKVLAFRIYDRWGKLVFSTEDADKGWDGTIGGKPAAMGNYFYDIKLGYPNNHTEVYKGSVLLMR